MTCHDTEEAMLDVLLGGSTVEARAALVTHLMSCDECRSRERALRNTWDALGSLTAPGPRPAVVERVRQTMMVATRPSQSMRIPRMSIRTRSLVQSLGAAALGALLTFVVVGRSAQVAQAPAQRGFRDHWSPSRRSVHHDHAPGGRRLHPASG